MAHQIIPTLSIAGSDCSGGAGMEADLKTMSALGCYAMAVITAVTAQNTKGVEAVEQVSPAMVERQIHAIFDDIPPLAIKIGMLGDAATMQAVHRELSRHPLPPLVIDPVMVATSGDRLMDATAIDTFTTLLLPLAPLLTPNVPEAEVLAERKISTRSDMEQAARAILARGCQAVLVKGGHLDGDEKQDVLVTSDGGTFWYSAPNVETRNTHGTGCTLSSAIAAYLAKGLPLSQAVDHAKQYLTKALESAKDMNVGHGHGPVNHFYML